MADVQSFDLPFTVEVCKIELQRRSRAGSQDSTYLMAPEGAVSRVHHSISMPSHLPSNHAIDCLWIVKTFPGGLPTSL